MLVLFLRLIFFALFHPFVGRSENLEVGLTERKLGGLNGGGPSFNIVDPVEEFTHGGMVATGSFRRELHCRCLDLRNFPSFPAYSGGYMVAGGLHD